MSVLTAVTIRTGVAFVAVSIVVSFAILAAAAWSAVMPVVIVVMMVADVATVAVNTAEAFVIRAATA